MEEKAFKEMCKWAVDHGNRPLTQQQAVKNAERIVCSRNDIWAMGIKRGGISRPAIPTFIDSSERRQQWTVPCT